MVDFQAIEEAAQLLKGRCRRTELIPSSYFSDLTDISVYLKCENLQRTGSFKIRGALNFILRQTPEDLRRGVITASAGNHAQGVALAARLQKIPALVVMPRTTPLAKIQATRSYGAEVLLHGEDYNAAADEAERLAAERGLLSVPPFDHPLVIAGQGTVALEILHLLPEAGTLLVPVGGGGLLAGIAVAARTLKPELHLVGVEARTVPAALLSRRAGDRIVLPEARSLADGIAVRQLGALTFPLIEELVDELVAVEEEEIAQAIVSLLERGKLVTEGAGAVSLAALLTGAVRGTKPPVVCVLSGGNIDVQTLSRVVERGMLAEGRYLKIRVDLPDVPGALADLATRIADLAANVFHVSHDRRSTALPLGRAEVHLELETRGDDHIREILQALDACGYGATVLN